MDTPWTVKRVQNLLGHYPIHGFRVRPEPNRDLDSEVTVAAFGSKTSIVKISWGQGRFRELWRSGLWNMSDWIWDARWLGEHCLGPGPQLGGAV